MLKIFPFEHNDNTFTDGGGFRNNITGVELMTLNHQPENVVLLTAVKDDRVLKNCISIPEQAMTTLCKEWLEQQGYVVVKPAETHYCGWCEEPYKPKDIEDTFEEPWNKELYCSGMCEFLDEEFVALGEVLDED